MAECPYPNYYSPIDFYNCIGESDDQRTHYRPIDASQLFFKLDKMMLQRQWDRNERRMFIRRLVDAIDSNTKERDFPIFGPQND
ncbi:hypothetical protein V1477_011334 [Vespula maculifrons]|uniref:Uncharacterized protein n=1 Tax=Vespula maculifrons TaxID=7453 RepID=A0ABD2C513_VESMC